MRCPEGRLREERRLSALGTPSGFARAAFVDPALLDAWASARRALPGAAAGKEAWVLSPADWARRISILACCLSCHRPGPDDPSTPGAPHGLVAPFARAHYYRAAVESLGRLADRWARDLGVPRRSVRALSNSRLPEKPLLVASGLAAIGKNGLCIAPGLGSMFVIACAVIPVPTREVLASPAVPAPDPCGGCTRCVRACPVGAIVAPGVVDASRCLQGVATEERPFSGSERAAWGARFYGCQDCQSCCPRNAGLAEFARPSPGEIGAGVPLDRFLGADGDGRRRLLEGTAMGMPWVPQRALVRNAIAAAGARRDPVVLPVLERCAEAADPLERQAARAELDAWRGEGR